VEQGKKNIVKELLTSSHRVDVNAVDDDDNTALMEAALYPFITESSYNESGYNEIVELLLSANDIDLNYINRNGDSAISLVMNNNNYIAAELLLRDDKLDLCLSMSKKERTEYGIDSKSIPSIISLLQKKK